MMCVCMSMRKRLAPEREAGRGREDDDEQHVEELELELESEEEVWMLRAMVGFTLAVGLSCPTWWKFWWTLAMAMFTYSARRGGIE